MRRSGNQDGLTLLITLLLMSVLLGISASILNVTLRQYQLSGIARASEMAFQAAQAGTECAMYVDIQNDRFDIDEGGTPRPPTSLSCFGQPAENDLANGVDGVTSGEEQRFRFEWSGVCTEVSVYKFSRTGVGNSEMAGVLGVTPGPNTKCPEGDASSPIECTVIKSRGYNTTCGNLSNPRTVEREITQRY